MSIESIVTGAANAVRELWPEGDPDKLRQAAAAYDRLAAGCRDATQTGSGAASRIGSAAEGSAADSFARYYKRVDAGLVELGDVAADVANRLREYADAIEQARDQIKGILIEIGAVLALAAAVSVVTLFIGAPAAQAAAIVRTGMLVRNAARVGITLSETAARLAVSGARGLATGAAISLAEIPLVKAAKREFGVDDEMNEGLWVALGSVFGGATSVAKTGLAIRNLNKIGAGKGWGPPKLSAPMSASKVPAHVRTVKPGESLATVKAEMDRLTYQTGREHMLVVDDKGVRRIIAGDHAGVVPGKTETPLVHTHPYGWPYKGPSRGDYVELHEKHLRTGVERATILEDGVEITYSIHDKAYLKLFPKKGG